MEAADFQHGDVTQSASAGYTQRAANWVRSTYRQVRSREARRTVEMEMLDYDTLKMIWDELRTERSNQYSRNASISVVATALLGFEGVIITRIPDLAVQTQLRMAAIVVLSVSIVLLLDCLLDMPFRGGTREWRQEGRSLRAIKPTELINDVEGLPSQEAVRQLITQAETMIQENHEYLLKRRRRILHRAVFLFALSFAVLGVAALIGGGDHGSGRRVPPCSHAPAVPARPCEPGWSPTPIGDV